MLKLLPERLNSLFKTSTLYFRFTWSFIPKTESLNGGRALHQEGVGEPYPKKTEVKNIYNKTIIYRNIMYLKRKKKMYIYLSKTYTKVQSVLKQCFVRSSVDTI